MTKKGSSRPKISALEAKICGRHACWAVFKARPDSIVKAYVTDALRGEFGKVLKFCAQKRLAYHIIPEEELARVSGSEHHEGVCFVVRETAGLTLDSVLNSRQRSQHPAVIIFLEGVENPHNFGAIARVAAHFGVDAILLDDKNPLTLSSAAYRVAEGGLESVPVIRISSIDSTLKKLRQAGFRVLSTIVEGGTDLFQAELKGPLLILFGAEGSGLSARAKSAADLAITIPGSGRVESLNVACATSVLLGEIWRQQKANRGRWL
ncbi:MAG: rRNA methyltransferase [Oligoflexia bacterium]|nr:rRNA methyltransferase [Oligoflexia bacterium]